MTKAELDLLERVFACDIEGRLYQTKSKLAQRLENEGFIINHSRSLGRDRFGEIIVKGYSLTFKGNFAYCSSNRCKQVEEK